MSLWSRGTFKVSGFEMTTQLLYVVENANTWASSRAGLSKRSLHSSSHQYGLHIEKSSKESCDKNKVRLTANHLTTWADFLKLFPWRRRREEAFRSLEWGNKSAVKDSVNRPKYLQPQSEQSQRHSSVCESRLRAQRHWWVTYWKDILPPTCISPFDPSSIWVWVCQVPVCLHLEVVILPFFPH